MREIATKPRQRRRVGPAVKKSAPVKYKPEDEASVDDVVAAQSQAAAKTAQRNTQREVAARERARPPVARLAKGEIPAKIQVQPNTAMKTTVPGHVWRTSPFKWDPVDFGAESEKLNEKIITAETQNNSLAMWLEDPAYPYVYGVSGNPDDSDAKYFAAYLVQAHMAFMGYKAHVVWHTLYGGFDNKLLREYDEIDGKSPPSLLVLSNLTPNSTNVKLDKARDLLERFNDIPRIVVAAGEDPFSFLTTRLYSPIHALAYFSSSLVKKRMEII